MLVALEVGCGPLADASSQSLYSLSESEKPSALSPVVIDAGIIFANEANYLCIPLSRFGVADSEEVLSVETSCDCTQPSIVSVNEAAERKSKGLRFDFVSEKNLVHLKPSQLAVSVTIRLKDRKALASVRFLRTVQNRVPNETAAIK